MTTSIPSVSTLKIEDYLRDLQYWLTADITSYKAGYSSSIARNPSDRTSAPGTTPPQSLPSVPIGHLSIPLAASILSAIEFCGFCLKGKFKDYSRSENNIKRFYKEIRPVLGTSAPANADVSKLIKSCRHGFAHKFFPKHLVGVGYLDYTADLFVSDGSNNVLNTSALITHITTGLAHILSSPALFPKMQSCYDDYLVQVENGKLLTVSFQKKYGKN